MDYLTLKTIHLIGLAQTFTGLAGVLGLKMAGDVPFKRRVIFHLFHSMGLLMLVISGIGMGMAMGIHSAPGWMKAKFAVWLLAGGSMVLAVRFSRFANYVVVWFVMLVATAAWLAICKPF
jgi:hypothetical protein